MNGTRTSKEYQVAVHLMRVSVKMDVLCHLSGDQCGAILDEHGKALVRAHDFEVELKEQRSELVRLKIIERFLNIALDEGDSPEYMVQDGEYEWALEALDFE